MKSRISHLKKILREQCQEGVDRVRRHKKGYGDEETGDDYHDVSEEFDLDDFEEESVDRSKRAKERGYTGEPGGDEPGVSYDVAAEIRGEKTPEKAIEKNDTGIEDVAQITFQKMKDKKKEELELEQPPSLAQRGAERIKMGQEVGADFKARAVAGIQSLLGTLRTDTERRSIYDLITKPQNAGGFKDMFLSPVSKGSAKLGPSGKAQVSAPDMEDPRKWSKQLAHKSQSMPKMSELCGDDHKKKEKQ